jgi:hypothetical protein
MTIMIERVMGVMGVDDTIIQKARKQGRGK